VLFPNNQFSHTCEWLSGTCAAICILESESLILALVTDYKNRLLGPALSKLPNRSEPVLSPTHLHPSQQDVTLVLGGAGVTLGELKIGAESMSWTPIRKSTLQEKATFS